MGELQTYRIRKFLKRDYRGVQRGEAETRYDSGRATQHDPGYSRLIGIETRQNNCLLLRVSAQRNELIYMKQQADQVGWG